MNFYIAPAFVDCLAEVYAPEGSGLRPRSFAAGGKVWLLPARADGKTLTDLPFLDYFEPAAILPAAEEAAYPAMRRLRRAALGTVTREEWFARQLYQSYHAAPLIEWAQFPAWEDFQAAVRQQGGQYWRDSRRRLNKLQRQLGAVEFRWHDPAPDAFAACLAWKGSQFEGIRRMFANARHRRFFELLVARGLLTVSSLRVPGGPVAVVLGVVWQGRYYYWIPSYDPAHRDCSPGRLLLEMIMAESHRQGHERFDFLLGSEGYKWLYATHTHLIGELGSWRGPLRRWLKRQLAPWREKGRDLAPAFGVRAGA